MKNISILFLFLIYLNSCTPEYEKDVVSKGNANFKIYVAMGSSESAGFADFATYDSAQRYCYPAIIATQLTSVGRIGEFLQPWMPHDCGLGVDQNKNLIAPYKLGYYTDCKGNTSVMPIPSCSPYANAEDANNILNTDITSLLKVVKNIYTSKGFHNMSACGAKSYNYLDKTYGTLGTSWNELTLIANMLTDGIETINPLFGRFCSQQGSSSVVDDAQKMKATFFTYWIGCNDVLGYAMEGVEGVAAVITDYGTFDQDMHEILVRMTSNGAKGAIANIPLVYYLPYFNVVKYNDLEYRSNQQDVINHLNSKYASINPAIHFQVGKNAYVATDPSAPGGVRQLVEGELIPLALPLDSILCNGWGTEKPIPAIYYLSANEINNIINATDHYNQTIWNLSQEFDLAYVDINDFFLKSRAGIWIGGVKYSSEYIKGGVFSLDGIHPSPRGNAIIANVFIKAINQHFGASIPLANVFDYPQIRLPD